MNVVRYQADRLVAAGLLMCGDDGLEEPAGQDVVWKLTQEAARTLASLPSPPRRGYPRKSAWPDFQDDNFFAVIRERISDNVEGEQTRVRLLPTAAAVDRCDVMWHLWQKHALPNLGKRLLLINAVWASAGGIRFRKIHAATGLSRYRLNKARTDGCYDVSKHLLGL